MKRILRKLAARKLSAASGPVAPMPRLRWY